MSCRHRRRPVLLASQPREPGSNRLDDALALAQVDAREAAMKRRGLERRQRKIIRVHRRCSPSYSVNQNAINVDYWGRESERGVDRRQRDRMDKPYEVGHRGART